MENRERKLTASSERAKDDRFLGPFTIAQLTSVILIAIGAALLSTWSKGTSPTPGTYLETGKKTP